jgi:hypothetical protein
MVCVWDAEVYVMVCVGCVGIRDGVCAVFRCT